MSAMVKIGELIKGYRRFYIQHYEDIDFYEQLAEGQMPKSLVVACSDSRVDPSILMDVKLGDIFVVRNVANLVPPYEPMSDSHHGTSAAIEFAVRNLNIEHIIVLGHSGCAGIQALVDANVENNAEEDFSFVTKWVEIAKEAKNRMLKKCDGHGADKYSTCEKEGIITSMQNLETFPWIKERVENEKLTIHGWYFSLTDTKLYSCSENGDFKEI